jgi:hypothetical protein
MRYLIIALAILLAPALPARAQFSIDFGAPGVSIGINMPVYPQLVLIPGYPVYYDPQVNSNYFFYDGLYWVYWGDNWYVSDWYNGPWQLVGPEYVPQFLLLVPVRYYRSPPSYFRGWSRDGPPRWGEHWGRSWEQRRAGWDRWDRRSVPAAAPLPLYQRQYSGSRYPRAIEQQQAIRSRNYRYQPRDVVAQQHFQQRAAQGQLRSQQQGQQQLQPQGNAARGRVQTQQPLQQGTAPQAEQQRQQMNRQRQQQQVQQQQQLQHQQQQQSTQTQQMGQGRPPQSAAQMQGRQNGPQERARINAGPAQAQGPQPLSAPRETRAAAQGPGPQGGGAENRGGPQARGGENRGAPQEARSVAQGKGEDKGARKGQVKQDENK